MTVMIPAVCSTCRTIFPSGIAVGGGTMNLRLVGNRAGPCPACGGSGDVLDGVFNVVGNAIEVLSAPQRTINELQRLEMILRRAREKDASLADVREEIRRDLPELRSLVGALPKTRSDLYAVISILLTIISLLRNKSPEARIEVHQVINNVYQSAPAALPSPPPAPARLAGTTAERGRQPGRNAPCPCGSGKKYKQCHGKPR